MSKTSDERDLSYREKDVDSTLTEHETRIGRLEKAALIGIGYGLAEGSVLITEASSLIL